MSKALPTTKAMPEVIEEYLESGWKEDPEPAWNGQNDWIVTVFEEYTPEMGRKPTSQGGWGRFSGVGEKYTTVRGSGGEMVG